MTSSGSLGHIYFAQVPDRLSLEEIAISVSRSRSRHSSAHEGIGLVLRAVRDRGAPSCWANGGIRELRRGRRSGAATIRWSDFEPAHRRLPGRLASTTNAGDIVVNGAFDPSTGQVIGIDDLVGAHGGVGGMQTQPFLAYPSDWTDDEPELVGAASAHHFLRRYALGEEPCADGPAEHAAVAGEVGAT